VEGVDLNSPAGKVLFLTVFASAGDPALEHARVLARESGSSLLVAEVDVDQLARKPTSPDVMQAPRLASAGDVATEVRRVTPDQVAKLVAGEDVDLILLGSHGRDGLRRLLQLVPTSAQPTASELIEELESAESATRRGGERLRDLLTPREVEVLVYLAQGLSVKECARVMRRSPSTIDNHKTRLMRKLGMHRVVDLARYAVREGLISK